MFLERITGNINGVINITNSLCRYIVINAIITNKNTMQLEKGSIATEYEPYQGSSLNITIPEGEFIGKINDTYKDTLNVVYKDDGHYHLILKKMIGKVVLDGSESWTDQGNGAYVTNVSDKYNRYGTEGLLCNYFHLRTGTETSNYEGIDNDATRVRVWNVGMTLADFKNWLSIHNTEVYYPLATPYEVDLGTIDEMPSTYEGTTYIWNDKKANINLSYRVYEGDYGHITYNYGDDVGFIYTDFTYPGELVGNAGDNISGIIDKIKGTLGNFEDFYDIYGNFRLQEIKNYLNTSHATTLLQNLTKDDYVIDQSQGKSVYDFSNSKLITSFSNTPQYLNIKNDYVV